MSNAIINCFSQVAKQTMNDHGTYKFFFNNCRHYGGHLIDDALSNKTLNTKGKMCQNNKKSKKKIEIKCVRNTKDCDILSGYVDYYCLKNYCGSTTNDIVSETENSFYYPIAYRKVLKMCDYEYKLEGVVKSGTLNTKSNTYIYKTRKCIERTEIFDIKTARMTDTKKIDPVGTQKDVSCKFYNDNMQGKLNKNFDYAQIQRMALKAFQHLCATDGQDYQTAINRNNLQTQCKHQRTTMFAMQILIVIYYSTDDHTTRHAVIQL